MSKNNGNSYSMKMLGKNKGEVTIYGDIGEYYAEVTPKEFKKDLDNLGEIDELDIRLHSPGGLISSGHAIYNTLKQHKAYKTAYIDGIAASMGSFILMAADKKVMSNAGMVMVHNPWGRCVGESKDMRAYADNLDKMGEIAIEVYSKGTGTSSEKIKELMDKTTYLNAEEALEYGFIDEIIDYDEEMKIDPNNKMLMMAGQKIDLSKLPAEQMLINKFLNLGIPQGSLKNEEGKMNKAELKEKHPKLYEEIYNEGVTGERTRMQGIEELVIPGSEGFLAKYKFDEPKAATEVAGLMVKAIKAGEISAVNSESAPPAGEVKPAEGEKPLNTGAEVFQQKVEDADNSGAGEVASSGDGHLSKEEKTKMEAQARAERIADKANKNRGL